jgi:Zn-dependent M16 (insulinase) family peptidase
MSFTLIEERFIGEIASSARIYRHDGTGARLLSLVNKDENKVFGISFRTPPVRSDGVAHILEHSVLCGSEKYPVKEPFVELMKGSLNTFLNAMTFPDKTVYPVASTNAKDFRNLVDVYLDAVFHPRLTEDTFRQEGWHYEVDPETKALSRKGVVYNEMKGAYSDPDDMHNDLCRRSLFPDTAYGLDSGGDPEVIPELDYETFLEFHKTYYHPSNSFIYFYGDDDPAERLALLDAWLAPYCKIQVDSLPGLQKPFPKPIEISQTYEGKEPKAWVAVNWALPGHGDPETSLGLGILAHILTGTPASPLRKILIDSGLGEDLAGFGLEDGLRQGAWSVGLKGVQPEKTAEVEALVLSTLESLADEGIDPAMIAASLNTVEFALREKNTGRYPRGLAVMLEALNEWLYDAPALETLAFSTHLESIKRKASLGGIYFEGLIRKWLVNNGHRSTVTLLPDPDAGERQKTREETKLAAIQAAMSDSEIAEYARAAEKLRELQDRRDSPEALATIPGLSLEDLPKEAARIPSEPIELGGVKGLYHDLPTSSIFYLDLAFSIEGVDSRLIPYLGVFGRALLEMGTDDLDFVRFSQEIGTHTGGIGASAFATTKWGGEKRGTEPAAYFIVRGKSLAAKTGKLCALLGEALFHARLEDRERFKQIVLEEKSQSESALIPAGHRLVGLRLRSRLTKADAISEKINGVEQLFFLRDLARRIDSDWDSVLGDMKALRGELILSNSAVLNITVDRDELAGIGKIVADLASALPKEGKTGKVPAKPAAALEAPKMEMLTAPSQVNFVGKAFPLPPDTARNGAYLVVKKYLDTTYLWEKVRVKGGAYGGFSAFDMNAGNFIFLSYRDPNLEGTFANFDGAAGFLAEVEVPREELVKSIIGTIGDVDSYLLPDAKGFTSLVHYLTGYAWEDRQKIRVQMLSASTADFRTLAAALRAAAPNAISGALGSRGSWEKLAEGLKSGSTLVEVL